MKREMKLPKPIDVYVRAINGGDADKLLSSFANREIFAVNVTLEVKDVVERDGQTIATLKIDGTFDRTGLPDPLLMAD